jgi:parallel beta-helix repeat protein
MQKRRGVCWALQRTLALVAVGAFAFFVAGAGQAATSQVDCGDVITHDTKLDHDLSDCPDNGLVIGADGVTLDLNGHTIDGDGACCDLVDYGIKNGTLFPPTTGYDNVTVKGGMIRQFAEGISVFGARKNVLRTLDVSDNSLGIRLHDADDSVFDLSNVFANGLGLDLRGSGSNLIRRNSFFDNGAGISIIQTTGNNVIERNLLSGNSGGGISAAFVLSGINRVVDNHLSEGGVILLKTSGFEIERNVIAHTSYPALLLLGAEATRIERNVMTDSGVGIALQMGSRNNHIAWNSVLDNERDGISLTLFPSANELLHNVVSGNGGSGIFIRSDNAGNLVRQNVTDRNGDDGIHVDGTANTLTRNSASSNADLGIEAGPGVVDGGGNRAEDNGNQLQCVGVVCS